VTRYERELERIREAYRSRDADAEATSDSAWKDPSYRFYMQWLEWRVLAALAADGARLTSRRALEVGCGSGYFAHRFAEYGVAHVAGIDLMEDRVAAARERYPGLELVAGDAGALPWEDRSFGLVMQFTCLSSILDAGVRARVAAEMWRVLEPGGTLLSFDMVSAHPLLHLIRRIRRIRPQGLTATTPIDFRELARLFPGAAAAQTATLALGAGALARRSRPAAEVLAALSFLRTHLLFVARKPG
jgi:SAM-dependent methyltransferase